jgi:hypothetical protein
MGIGPVNTGAAAPGGARVEPVTQASLVRQVIGRLAAIAQAGPVDPQPQATLQARLAQAVNAAVQAAAPRQGGLGPLMADLQQTLAILPPAVQAAALKVLAQQTPLGPAVTSADLKAAVASSGLFLEARMAAAAQAGPDAGSPPPPLDLKAALLVARQALAQWSRTAAAAPDAPPLAGRPAGAPPAPPMRQGPPAPQPQAHASLPADAPPALAAGRLLQEADAAIARQELLQAASLPEALQPTPGRIGPAGPHWLFELPFTGPQGQGVAQFEVEGEAEGEGRTWARAWRARFSVDVEPFGPLHAQLSLVGRRAGVALWAERPEAAEQFAAWKGELADALEAADYLPEITVVSGPPPRAPTASGVLVDRTS